MVAVFPAPGVAGGHSWRDQRRLERSCRFWTWMCESGVRERDRGPSARLVLARTSTRRVALPVDDVLGVIEVDGAPPVSPRRADARADRRHRRTA